MKKILVAYYSRTGNTKKVAELIAQKLGADIEEIKDTAKRQGLFGWLKSGRAGMKKILTTLHPVEKNPAEYDLVVLGTPIWVNMSSPVRTYVTEQKSNFRQVAFFCTMGGSKSQGVFADMAESTGLEPLAILAIREREVKAGNIEKSVTDFTEKLSN